MAEASAARDMLPPTGVAAAAGEGLAADGQPVLEVPPLVEFGDAFEAAAGEPAAIMQTAPPIAPDGNAATPTPIQRPLPSHLRSKNWLRWPFQMCAPGHRRRKWSLRILSS